MELDFAHIKNCFKFVETKTEITWNKQIVLQTSLRSLTLIGV
jgi:hypothetical protein